MGRTAQTVAYTLFVATAFILAGCGTSSETTGKGTSAEGGTEANRYEAGFHPSDYDPAPDSANAASRMGLSPYSPAGDTLIAAAPPEYVSGFRVQVMTTRSIDDAKALKAQLEAAYPAEWFYMVFDPPAYKIRGGNFLQRYDAEHFAQILEQAGFSGAWPVPDRVIKNPPPPPAPTPQ